MIGDPDEGLVHLKQVTGIPHYVTFHVWNLIIVVDSIGKFFLYNTNLFGRDTQRRGILSACPPLWAGLLISALCICFLLVGRMEKDFIAMRLYRTNVIVLGIASACYAVDGMFFLLDKRTFCDMQLEHRSACESRNEFFLAQVLFFFVFWAPLWFLSADAMRRYALEPKKAERGEGRVREKGESMQGH